MVILFFFQAEDGIRDLVRSRGLGDVYKRQVILQIAGNLMGVMVAQQQLQVFLLAGEVLLIQELSLIHI